MHWVFMKYGLVIGVNGPGVVNIYYEIYWLEPSVVGIRR